MNRLFSIGIIIFLSGCATIDFDTKLGYRIYDVMPLTQNGKGTCVLQSQLYAYLIKGEVFSNGKHSFVVKDNKIYDSTHMEYTGLSIDSECVREHYGEVSSWKNRN